MLPPLFTWIALPHLPQVPEHFVKLGLDKVNNPAESNQNFSLKITTPDYMNRKLVMNGQQINSRCQVNFAMGAEWESWVQANIIDTYLETGIRKSVGDSTVAGPHVDNPGKLRFYYLIDRGGDNVETVWYIKPGEPAIFDMSTWDRPYPYSHDNIDELIVLDRARFPLNTWILFNGYILHGVHNVEYDRINFNISFKPEDIDFNITTKV